MPRFNARELDRLRLPELQQRYREVVGEDTRCPNRTFLIRKILEHADAQPAAAATAQPVSAATEPTAPASAPTTQAAPTPPPQPPTPLPAPLPQLAARAARARRPKVDPRRARATSRARAERGRFSAMTVEELQTEYLSIVGRPTGSTDRPYLIWKIREAEKGRVPIGPRQTRTAEQQAKIDQRVLPLRLEAQHVAALDRAWRSQGLKSRMELLRRALGLYLAHIGAHAAAALFSSPESP